jgi:cation diffusion facilitator family transporter
MPDTKPAQDEATVFPLVGAGVNASLAVLKILAGTFGNSYALIADGIESTADIVSSLIVWGGLVVASRPPDEKHPYGYGKAEAVTAAVAALALLAAAAVIAVQSVREIITPHHLPHWSTLVVLAVVVVSKEWMARWVKRAGAEMDSTALHADAWHHRADALTSVAAFVGITIGLVGGPGYEPADDYAALAACCVITYSGCRLLVRGVREMLDVAPPDSVAAQVRELAASVSGVLAVEKCRIRKSGTAYFVDIHIEVDGSTPVRAAHIIGGKVRSTLRDSPLRIADALVHIEPFGEE